jgi:beta-mannosidase
MKKTTYSLGALDWTLRGFVPFEWHLGKTVESGTILQGEVPPIPVAVPGSVQMALRKAGMLPDWRLGLNYRECEWVENRHWVYETHLPAGWSDERGTCFLRFDGLDQRGSILLNGRRIHEFENAHLPCRIDVTDDLSETDNVLTIVFECPPRWLGQFGRTSEMREWKPRYNYGWDWTARLVQIGVTDDIVLEVVDDGEIVDISTSASIDVAAGTADLSIRGEVHAPDACVLEISLRDPSGDIVAGATAAVAQFNDTGITLEGLDVALWWPNGQGDHPLYDIEARLIDGQGTVDEKHRVTGFRSVAWRSAEGAPDAADPWICVVNDQPVFIRGINWTPIRPNFADLTEDDYRTRLEVYQDMGVNLLRVWGGGFLEKECFYRICDELGLMVWQEFPLSSSGVENYPPDDRESIDELAKTAESFVLRRRMHPSLIIWCGGNELSSNRERPPIPVTMDHPLIARFATIVKALDPDRRFLSSTPSGPSSGARIENYGKGIHWAVNGPWRADGRLTEHWTAYWTQDDALMRSELGVPGPSPADIIMRYSGGCEPFPCTIDNPLWRRSSWWIEWDQYVSETGQEPIDLAEYVEWGQKRQADALRIAVSACKNRFPRCGGVIIWMGHDSYPCTANTSVVDFEGRPKPAGLALKEIFRG